MKKSGYTLVELLAVLVILGLLVVIVGNMVIKTIEQTKTTVKKTQEQSVLKAAEKWSVDYSEEFDSMEAARIELGLDVLFILDISGSMKEFIPDSPPLDGYENTRRSYAMVEAFNAAMTALESSNNRQAVKMYGGSTVTFLPLASYSSVSGKYMKMERGNRQGNNFQTTEDLRQNGFLIDPILSQGYIGGTYTQGGIIDGSQILLDVPPEETVGRIPVVILLTDGDPTVRDETRCSICSEAHATALGLEGEKLNHYYALMAGYEYTKKIQEHYRGNDIYVYTIGLGVSVSSRRMKLLKPSSYAVTAPYNYVTKAFVNQNMSVTELRQIFEDIASEVVAATNVERVCVSIKELYELGYLNKDDIEFDSGDMENNFVIVSYNEPTNQFTYVITKTEAQRDVCRALQNS